VPYTHILPVPAKYGLAIVPFKLTVKGISGDRILFYFEFVENRTVKIRLDRIYKIEYKAKQRILMEKLLNEYLKHPCPSIQLRIKKEIAKENPTVKDKRKFEKLILQGNTINTILNWQMPDGYFGARLHTAPSNSKVWPHEGCVRYLLEMGLSAKFKPLKNALHIMLKDGCWEKEFKDSKAGEVLGCGIIRASLFSQAGLHTYDFIENYIKNALSSFEIIAKAKSVSDMIIPYKDKNIYVNGKCLPAVYDFRILAFTFSWRTESNIEMLKKAYKNLYKWLPFPLAYIKAGSQLVAPLVQFIYR
jgi:hypothetical protein